MTVLSAILRRDSVSLRHFPGILIQRRQWSTAGPAQGLFHPSTVTVKLWNFVNKDVSTELPLYKHLISAIWNMVPVRESRGEAQVDQTMTSRKTSR